MENYDKNYLDLIIKLRNKRKEYFSAQKELDDVYEKIKKIPNLQKNIENRYNDYFQIQQEIENIKLRRKLNNLHEEVEPQAIVKIESKYLYSYSYKTRFWIRNVTGPYLHALLEIRPFSESGSELKKRCVYEIEDRLLRWGHIKEKIKRVEIDDSDSDKIKIY